MRIASGLLSRLVAEAREETGARRRRCPAAALDRLARAQPPTRNFGASLRGSRLRLLAEMKQRTPTMGLLSADYRPARLAADYELAGAAALSVLCQETSFGGRPEHLAEARSATALPILRKDFIVDEYQLVEARALGADAVLLIVAALPAGLLIELLAASRELGLEALVEVHDGAEVEVALEAGARMLGVNNRDLVTFTVDLGLTERLRPLVPEGVVYVAESGIHDAAGARRMREAGADAILVGEALMRAPDPTAKLRELAV